MSAKYWQKGETLDYTAAEAVKNGDIVNLNTRIGVAGNDIAAGETGAVHVEGVFEMPKAAGEITLGAVVYWDEAAQEITTEGSATVTEGEGEDAAETTVANIPAGYAVAAADASASVVLVKLLG